MVFRTERPGDWRHLDLVATFPIHPAHFWATRDVGAASMEAPLGSGPYRAVAIEPNDRVVLERAPDYWGAARPVNRGRWRFDRVETLYFREPAAIVEALKAGVLDLHEETDASAWAEAYDGPALAEGRLVRTTRPHGEGGTLAALVFNQRRPPLDDARVRRALALAFDAEWTRETLFDSLYAPFESYYGDTLLAARGAASAGERVLLAPFLSALPEGVLDRPGPPPPPGEGRRARLRAADALLRAAGYGVEGGRRVHEVTGEALDLVYVGATARLDRVLAPYRASLARLGVGLEVRTRDYASARRMILDHAFDLTALAWTPSFPPGVRERFYWHSERAGERGYGLAGARDPALDALIDTMLAARDLRAIVPAARAFDRVMRWRHHGLGMWRRDARWFVHDARLAHPESEVAPDVVARWWWRPG